MLKIIIPSNFLCYSFLHALSVWSVACSSRGKIRLVTSGSSSPLSHGPLTKTICGIWTLRRIHNPIQALSSPSTEMAKVKRGKRTNGSQGRHCLCALWGLIHINENCYEKASRVTINSVIIFFTHTGNHALEIPKFKNRVAKAPNSAPRKQSFSQALQIKESCAVRKPQRK